MYTKFNQQKNSFLVADFTPPCNDSWQFKEDLA